MKHISNGLFVLLLGFVIVFICSYIFRNEFENTLLFCILVSILYLAAIIGVSTSIIIDKIKK